ncbi:MAG: phosphatase PAP2 family protein [Spirochaetia bacterium]
MRCHKNGLLVVVVCALVISVPRPAIAEELNVNLVTDGIILAGGLAAAGLSELLPSLPPPWGALGTPDAASVNPLDRAFMYPYSQGFDAASTVLEYTSVAAPLLFALVLDSHDILPIGIVYGEAVSYALAVKNVVDYLVPRYRPYVYEGGTSLVSSSEDDQSFPSGHATVVFAAATAGVTIYAMSFPGSPYFVPFTIASYGVAVLTGAFRVAAGMHFVTDVVAGAALGSAIGFLVPFLHGVRASATGDSGLSLETAGQELVLRYRY